MLKASPHLRTLELQVHVDGQKAWKIGNGKIIQLSHWPSTIIANHQPNRWWSRSKDKKIIFIKDQKLGRKSSWRGESNKRTCDNLTVIKTNMGQLEVMERTGNFSGIRIQWEFFYDEGAVFNFSTVSQIWTFCTRLLNRLCEKESDVSERCKTNIPTLPLASSN